MTVYAPPSPLTGVAGTRGYGPHIFTQRRLAGRVAVDPGIDARHVRCTANVDCFALHAHFDRPWHYSQVRKTIGCTYAHPVNPLPSDSGAADEFVMRFQDIGLNGLKEAVVAIDGMGGRGIEPVLFELCIDFTPTPDGGIALADLLAMLQRHLAPRADLIKRPRYYNHDLTLPKRRRTVMLATRSASDPDWDFAPLPILGGTIYIGSHRAKDNYPADPIAYRVYLKEGRAVRVEVTLTGDALGELGVDTMAGIRHPDYRRLASLFRFRTITIPARYSNDPTVAVAQKHSESFNRQLLRTGMFAVTTAHQPQPKRAGGRTVALRHWNGKVLEAIRYLFERSARWT